MDKMEVFGVVEIKPTWRLAWGLFWKWFLINLGIYAIIGVIWYFLVLQSIISLLEGLFKGLL